MKKLLACVLAFLLLLSAAIPAFAAESAPDLATAVVTAIEAEWDGTIERFDAWRLAPYSLSKESVTITLLVEGHGPVVLDRWSGIAESRVVWHVASSISGNGETATFLFFSTYFEQAFEAAHGIKYYQDYPAYYATLPQTSFQLPENCAEIYIKQQESIPALSLGVAGSWPDELYTFTPEKSGTYYVRGVNLWTQIVIFNSRFEEIAREEPYNFGYFSMRFEAGETYYIFNSTQDVRIDDSLRPLNRTVISDFVMTVFAVFSVAALFGFGILLSPFSWLLSLFRR
ncbi:MAG: hypothetical protein FWE85_05915 [Clostridiales bacterium]|nr:hypothetical protein [Clostridiales bacterium]